MVYTGDWEIPGALEVAVAHSTQAHALLRAVHTESARAEPGVVEVVTGADLVEILGGDHRTGPAFADQPILACERVRYFGEPVAAVVASDAEIARRAAASITCEYEPLEAVLDVDLAASGPPFVHDELRPSKVFQDLSHLAGQRDTNVCYRFNLLNGDVDATRRESQHWLEGEFWTPAVAHVPMELPSALAWVETDRLELVSATQTPSYVRQSVADVLGLPLHRVRVRVPHVGGGFGSKMYDRLEPLVAVLAWHLRRPVRLTFTRDEAFSQITRHGVAVRMGLGADQSSSLTAAVCDVRYDTGAYADIGPRICAKSGLVASGPYSLQATSISSRCIYTNKPPAGAYRGFGVPQLVFAHESMIDAMARTCGDDPYGFRRKNLLCEGDEHPVGTKMHSADLVGCLDAVAGALDWGAPVDRGSGRFLTGRGLAVGLKAVLTPTISGAVVQLNQDASASVLVSTVDMGQGSDTILAQIAAEVLTIPPERVRVVDTDTNASPYDTITAGSRSTYHMGNAVRLAAQSVRDQLMEMAAEVLGVEASLLSLAGGEACKSDGSGPSIQLEDLLLAYWGSRGTTVTGQATHRTRWVPYDSDNGRSPQVTEHWFAGAVAAQVTVDCANGTVAVDHLAIAGDVGSAINPRLCRQQLVGGALMGLGHALFDELVFDNGRPVNTSLLDYQLPSFRDVPHKVTPILVEDAHDTGPFGAKGVGETGILAVAPAVANAICDATGVRLYRLPMTRERVLSALNGSGHA
jgi:CO/xanthine dehydrogenase Mo-binding subunit